MHRLFASVGLTLLLVYAPTGDAFAGTGTGHQSKSRSMSAHSGSHRSTLSHHRARGANGSQGTYYSQLLRGKSEWHQAQRRGSKPGSVAVVMDVDR
jgi:hypothetical protein